MKSRSLARRGILNGNPVAMVLVGLCPAAAVTTRVIDALWMSVGVFSVLLLTRVCLSLLSLLRDGESAGPSADLRGGEGAPRIRWLGALLIASCLTASFELVLLAFAPEESASLGIYAPLIAVNCIVLDRVEPAAGGKHIPTALLDACGLGLGFAFALLLIAAVREVLGAGTITLFPAGTFGGTIEIPGLSSAPARALGYAGGGLICLGYLAGLSRLLRRRPVPAAEEAGTA
ncbi:MAG TPA: Rnf-Nqr domain containing protein [Spirochaetia bacterium]|nr:Rnf-Nqr domain containing protein [Spirochaetia bacterium]